MCSIVYEDCFHFHRLFIEGIGKLLTKQAMRKHFIIYRNCMHSLTISQYSHHQSRHLSYWGIHFCMLVSKKSAGSKLNHFFWKTSKTVKGHSG
jgi:uncharacterized CHY-type Zn-finger protein